MSFNPPKLLEFYIATNLTKQNSTMGNLYGEKLIRKPDGTCFLYGEVSC